VFGIWRKGSAATLVAAVACALALASCASSSSNGVAQLTTTTQGGAVTTSPASTPVSQALDFARCMRSKGVSNFPDPNSSAEFNKSIMSQLAASNPDYSSATRSCARLLPGVGGVTPALAQEIANDEAKFVDCMRSHGVPNWPGPVLMQGRLIFDPQSAGIDPNAPKMVAKIQACDYVFPASVGVPPGAGHNPS
jgi:hypothetical protein